jgi:TonB family protein
MRPDDRLGHLLAEFPPLVAGKVAAFASRPEPALGTALGFVGFDDPPPLDLLRVTPEPKSPPRRPKMLTAGVIASCGLHLLPLLLLLRWAGAPVEVARPIPVQLVVEPPPPPAPPPPQPQPEKKPPPGRLASESMGEPAPQPERPAAAVTPTTAAAPPAETQTAAVVPPPPVPTPASKPVPTPTPQPAAALPETPLPPPPKPAVKRVAAAQPVPRRRPAPSAARHPGPLATRDAYLAYCMSLVRRYFGMLPASFIAGRRGVTTLAIVVLDDGTIGRVSVLHASGYPDIDSRVEEMLTAVRRFPPLPQWVQGPSVVLFYDMPFPEGLRGQ